MRIRDHGRVYEQVEGAMWIGPCTHCGEPHEFRVRGEWKTGRQRLCRACKPGGERRGRKNASTSEAYWFMRRLLGPHPWRMKLAEIKRRGCPGCDSTVAKALDRLVAEKRVAYRAGYVRTLAPEEQDRLMYRRGERAQSALDAAEVLVKRVMPRTMSRAWVDEDDAVAALVERHGVEEHAARAGVTVAVQRGTVRRGVIRRRIALEEHFRAA